MGQNIPGCGEGSGAGLPMETELLILVCNVLNPELGADYNLYSSLLSHPLCLSQEILGLGSYWSLSLAKVFSRYSG